MMTAASAAHTVSNPVSLDLSATEVVTVTFNRPHGRNAYDVATERELARIFEYLGRREDVEIVIVRGAGPHFCAGWQLFCKSAVPLGQSRPPHEFRHEDQAN